MSRIFIFLLILILSGCRNYFKIIPDVGDLNEVSPELSRDFIQYQNNVRGDYLKGGISGELYVVKDGTKQGFLVSLVRNGELLRTEFFVGPLRELVLFAISNGEDIKGFFPKDETYFEGKSTSSDFKKEFGLPLAPMQLYEILLGVPNCEGKLAQSEFGLGLLVFQCKLFKGGFIKQEIAFEMGRFETKRLAFNLDGKTGYAEYTEDEVILKIEGYDGGFRFKSKRKNIEDLPESLFTVEKPDGFKELKFE